MRRGIKPAWAAGSRKRYVRERPARGSDWPERVGARRGLMTGSGVTHHPCGTAVAGDHGPRAAIHSDTRPRSRGADGARRCCPNHPRATRGRGECRVPNAPAASCALCSFSMHTSIHSGGTGNIRHSPRNGFNSLLRALPGDRALLPPSFAGLARALDASVGAPGPHAFAVRAPPHRKSHSTVLVPFRRSSNEGGFSVIRLLTLPRPPHPAPTSVTIAKRPSDGAG